MSEERKFGALQARFDEPDIVFARGDGEMDGQSMSAFNRHCEAIASKLGPVYLVVDIEGLTGLSPEARKVATDFTDNVSPYAGMVFFGGSFAVRTLVTMMFRAGQLLGRDMGEMNFVSTEAEARAWVGEQRKKRDRASA